ncbi:MAG: hypothetical protein OXJ52_03830 [Oligoflexia bacterium]|nr:hypothetical protein [Oligoflexia bacterium]
MSKIFNGKAFSVLYFATMRLQVALWSKPVLAQPEAELISSLSIENFYFLNGFCYSFKI